MFQNEIGQALSFNIEMLKQFSRHRYFSVYFSLKNKFCINIKILIINFSPRIAMMDSKLAHVGKQMKSLVMKKLNLKIN